MKSSEARGLHEMFAVAVAFDLHACSGGHQLLKFVNREFDVGRAQVFLELRSLAHRARQKALAERAVSRTLWR